MKDRDRQQLYYQGLADLHMMVGAVAVLNGAMVDWIPTADRPALKQIERLCKACILRGPERFHHVVEDTSAREFVA